MKFLLEIELGNEAMQTGNDVAQALSARACCRGMSISQATILN